MLPVLLRSCRCCEVQEIVADFVSFVFVCLSFLCFCCSMSCISLDDDEMEFIKYVCLLMMMRSSSVLHLQIFAVDDDDPNFYNWWIDFPGNLSLGALLLVGESCLQGLDLFGVVSTKSQSNGECHGRKACNTYNHICCCIPKTWKQQQPVQSLHTERDLGYSNSLDFTPTSEVKLISTEEEQDNNNKAGIFFNCKDSDSNGRNRTGSEGVIPRSGAEI